MKRFPIALALVVVLSLAVGCASGGRRGPHAGSGGVMATKPMAAAAAESPVPDPLEPVNRAIFHFNDKFYFWLLRPVGRGYGAVVPESVRHGVANVFTNTGAPARVVNYALQNRSEAANREVGRFLMNTLFGGLGYHDFDPPAEPGPGSGTNMNETLASYGAGEGIFLTWPVLGPATVRSTVGRVGDWFMDPGRLIDPWELRAAARATETVNGTSLALGRYEEVRNSGSDPYIAVRNGYLQRQAAAAE